MIGAQNLTKANVRRVLQRKLDAKMRTVDLKAEDVLLAIQRGVRRDIRTLFDEHGNPLPIHVLSGAEQATIASYEVILKKAKAGDGIIKVLKVKLEDHAKFVELAARYFGLLTKRVEDSGDAEFIAALHAARERASKASDSMRKKDLDA